MCQQLVCARARMWNQAAWLWSPCSWTLGDPVSHVSPPPKPFQHGLLFSVLPTGQDAWLIHTAMLSSPPSLPTLHNSPRGLSQVLYFIDLNLSHPSRLATLSSTKLPVLPSHTQSSPVWVNTTGMQGGQGNRYLFLTCLTLPTPLNYNDRRTESIAFFCIGVLWLAVGLKTAIENSFWLETSGCMPFIWSPFFP